MTDARSAGRVGVLVPVVFDEYFARILHGVADAVYEQRLRLMLWPTRHEHAREVALLEELREATDGGLLVLPEQSSEELLHALSDGYPLVVIDPLVPLDARIPSVAAANASGAEQAIQYLIDLGHRRIGAIAGPPGWVATEERRRAYRGTLAAAGIPFDPALELEADFDFESGTQAAVALLDTVRPPTAIFAFSDMIAIGAMRAARARGIGIPDELSIVGFDDTAYATVVHPALTTVRQPLNEMGATAVELLVRLMRKEPVDTLHLEPFTRLVVRETTSPPRVGG
ncbi:MAG TPA: substrate-binding domain-containing protein [Gaiellaceae bacterium]|nr:substrate-binding domain-containing protein [Gaiellaceae bacterium]HUK97737.1 substrate-binding domain-containing protein [Gaiellaceae bacterium]